MSKKEMVVMLQQRRSFAPRYWHLPLINSLGWVSGVLKYLESEGIGYQCSL